MKVLEMQQVYASDLSLLSGLVETANVKGYWNYRERVWGSAESERPEVVLLTDA